MYSAVLMLALTAGSETADHGRNRCHGCTVTATSCSVAASCSHSCARPRLFGNRCSHSCSSSHGCTTTVVASCSHSCSHSCRGGGLFARLRDRRCHGCSVSHGCTSGCTTVVVPEKKAMPKTPEAVPAPKKTTLSAVPATIIVSLPADARLIVDGAPTNSTSDRRTLVTPALEVGSTFVYTMQAEVVRDGRTVAQTQEVTVRGGETSTVRFQFSTQTVASR